MDDRGQQKLAPVHWSELNMASPKFKWTHSANFHQDAQIVGERLQILQARNGSRLTPALVLDDARHANSPLNPCFEWDNQRAGDQWRTEQARNLIRSVRVLHEGVSGDMRTLRAFVHVTEGGDGEPRSQSYRPLSVILQDDDLRQRVLMKAAADMRSFIARYQEFAELVNAAQDLIDLIEDLQGTPSAPAGVPRVGLSLTE